MKTDINIFNNKVIARFAFRHKLQAIFELIKAAAPLTIPAESRGDLSEQF
ncbi:MAG: hypothetical protein IJ532_05625 [Alphaproteobacteria bacterium]|nr:hypothetical protein [Alphaproteobacteria bacterium]